MLQRKTITTSWGMGLSNEQAGLLQEYLGEDHTLTLHPAGHVPSFKELDVENPCVIWISSSSCKEFASLPQGQMQYLEFLPKVLILDNEYSLSDFESACDYGITEIVRPPLSRERIADIMRRALETMSIHHDVHCMTREILLERELLERKNELLNFLVNFLTHTSESLDLEQLIQTAYEGLGQLLPMRAMHAVLWETDGLNTPSLSMRISSPEGSASYEAWRELLLEQARLMIGPEYSVEEIKLLRLHNQPEEWSTSMPDEGALLCLPIISGSERLGALFLLTSMERHLGRDQAAALDSAMRHFALNVKNSRRFRMMQKYADYDALTRVHSRRHFEHRFDEEMQRLTRYAQPLSLLMLDIDHFKQVNDTRGHHVGDIVLREVASLVSDSIRNSDYCARFGGEEFVIILPYTSRQKAIALAERIRKNVERHTFLVDGGEPLELTVSLGIASATPNCGKNKQALLCEADTALYKAKADGRNRTCSAPVNLVVPTTKAASL